MPSLIDAVTGAVALVIGILLGALWARPRVISARLEVKSINAELQSTNAALAEAKSNQIKLEAEIVKSQAESVRATKELAESRQSMTQKLARLQLLTLSGLPQFTVTGVRHLVANTYQIAGSLSDMRDLRQGDWYWLWIPGSEPLLGYLYFLDVYSGSGTLESIIAETQPAIGAKYPIL